MLHSQFMLLPNKKKENSAQMMTSCLVLMLGVVASTQDQTSMTEGKNSFLLGMKHYLLWLRILENFRKPGRECTLDPDQRSARDAKMTEVPRLSLKPNPTWPHARETCSSTADCLLRRLEQASHQSSSALSLDSILHQSSQPRNQIEWKEV